MSVRSSLPFACHDASLIRHLMLYAVCAKHLWLACRYRVVYRLVNTVYIMAVASAAANVFALMKLVDALTVIATLASRGVEVTPEKLSRRYPEVGLL